MVVQEENFAGRHGEVAGVSRLEVVDHVGVLQRGMHLIGGDAFQETDVTGITLPITKHNFLITSAAEVAPAVREAFYIARSGRPGPVLLDFCKNAQIEKIEFEYPEEMTLPGYHPPERAPIPGSGRHRARGGSTRGLPGGRRATGREPAGPCWWSRWATEHRER